jgi:8-amino-7-oxononanoate synthase
MNSLDARLKAALDSRKARGILRKVPPSSELVDQPKQIDFSSNDYLSLATSPQLKHSFVEKIRSFPRILGSGGSRLLDGGTLEHALLEERLAAFFGSPAALLYTSGFDANVGFFGSVPSEGDVVIYDSLIHASVHDGMRVSRAARQPESLLPFDHNCISSLRSVIKSALQTRSRLARGDGCVFIAIESLYSMDGDIAPMKEICEVVEGLLPHKNGHVIVDEAHATGVYGRNGRGLVTYLGLENRITARLHTFGKALASSGGMLSLPSDSALIHPITSFVDSCFPDKPDRSRLFGQLLPSPGVYHFHVVWNCRQPPRSV